MLKMKQMLISLLLLLSLAAGAQESHDTYETDVFTTPGGRTVTFHALVHASIRIEYNGWQIYIDP